MTDTERLDYLQQLTCCYGDGWILRESSTGRGMRLHETTSYKEDTASPTVREAIDNHAKRMLW